MLTWSTRLRRASVLAAALVGAACASAPESDSEPDDAGVADPPPSTIREVRFAIDEAIGEARADSLGQCALVALGQKPCGGPRLYLAYSIAETDSAYLATLVEAYDRLDRQRNAEQGLVSTCEVLERPPVAFVGGQCVLGPSGGDEASESIGKGN